MISKPILYGAPLHTDRPVNKDLLWWLKSTAGNKHPCHWILQTNAANRDAQTKPQNAFTDHSNLSYSDYNPAIVGRVWDTEQPQLIWWERKIQGVYFRRSHFIASSVCVPFNHSWKFWNCAENVATCQERGTERKGNRERELEREREKGTIGACARSQQRSEGGPMGATHTCTGRPPPSLLRGAAARGLVAPPWFPPPTVPSSFTNHGVWLPSDPPSRFVHEIHSYTRTHFLPCTIIFSTYSTWTQNKTKTIVAY